MDAAGLVVKVTVGLATPVPVNELVIESNGEVDFIFIVAVLAPELDGVKVTSYVAVPFAVRLEGAFETANSAPFEVTVNPVTADDVLLVIV